MVMPFPIAPVLATAGIGWVVYRRIRRQFGWQPWQPRRATARLVLLGLVACALAYAAIALPHVAPGIVLGAIAGAGIGWGNLSLTRLETRDGKPGYVPHPWIGAGLSLLLVGRLAWRFYSGAFAAGGQHAMQNASPLTLGIAATLIAYYLVYLIGLTMKLRTTAPPANTPLVQ